MLDRPTCRFLLLACVVSTIYALCPDSAAVPNAGGVLLSGNTSGLQEMIPLGLTLCQTFNDSAISSFYSYSPPHKALATRFSLCNTTNVGLSLVILEADTSCNAVTCPTVYTENSSRCLVVTSTLAPGVLTTFLISVQEVGDGAVSFTLQVQEVPLCTSIATMYGTVLSTSRSIDVPHLVSEYGLPNCVPERDIVVLLRRFVPRENHMELIVSLTLEFDVPASVV